MKKLFLVVAVVCACGLYSCDPNKPQCWEIIVTNKDTHATVTHMLWADGDTSDEYIRKLAVGGNTATKKPTVLGEGECGTYIPVE